METMTCDIAIKMYDRALKYAVIAKQDEPYLITNAEVETIKEANSLAENELDAARINVHEFASNFLDGCGTGVRPRPNYPTKFEGTDMKNKGPYWANTIIVYVNVTVPREEVEELVIALAEEFAGKEEPACSPS